MRVRGAAGLGIVAAVLAEEREVELELPESSREEDDEEDGLGSSFRRRSAGIFLVEGGWAAR